MSILLRTATGAGWVVAWRMTTRLLGLVSTLVLARILVPADFGLVALAYACGATLDACLNMGVEQQIIRARNPDRSLYDTAFTLNLLRGFGIALLLVLAAGPIAGFFGDPRLQPVVLVLALLPAISGFNNIGTADFQRNMAFGTEFRMQVVPRLVTLATSLTIALVFRTHWALVLSMVAGRSCTLLVSYVMHPYRPRLSLSAWHELAGVSFWIWACNVAGTARDMIDRFLIGRLLGPAALGAYNLGAELATLPGSEVAAPIARACMPGFAAAEREGGAAATRDAFLRIMALTGLLMLPAGLGIALVAQPLVFLAVGPAWQAAVPVVAIIGIASTAQPFANIGQALISAHVRMRLMFAIFLAGMLLRGGLLLALIPLAGLAGAAAALALSLLVEAVMMVHAACRLLRLDSREVPKRCWRPLLAAVGMVLAVWASGLAGGGFPTSAAAALGQLTATVALGAVSFAGLAGLLWLACGRPEGAEADLLRLLERVLGGVVRRFRPRPSSAPAE